MPIIHTYISIFIISINFNSYHSSNLIIVLLSIYN
nr:MAG TPA: hypothetical protein [Bacteriophage sp.]